MAANTALAKLLAVVPPNVAVTVANELVPNCVTATVKLLPLVSAPLGVLPVTMVFGPALRNNNLTPHKFLLELI
jgi:hypothetical protein